MSFVVQIGLSLSGSPFSVSMAWGRYAVYE